MARKLKGHCPNPRCKKDLSKVRTQPHCDSASCPWDVCSCKAVLQPGSLFWFDGGSPLTAPRIPNEGGS